MSPPADRPSMVPGGGSERPSAWPGDPTSSSRALDVISQNEGDLPRRREARDAGAEVVAALFRLVKLSTMHAADNLAVVQRIEEIVEAVRAYGARSGRNVSMLFLDDTVFVGGQLLQANRTLYDCARELGTILGRAGVSEVGIAREARQADFHALANVLAEVLRGPRGARLPERPTPRIRLRAASPLALRREGPTDRLDPAANAANAYASACVVMRRLYESLGKGQLALPHRVKRVAQRLVDLSAGEMPAFLGVTDAKRGGHDDAQRAVNASILTLAMARQITNDPVLLSRVAMAALLSDLGRYHVAGAFPGSGRLVPQLGAEQEKRVPASTAMLLTAMGRVNEPSVMRTVMAYEACVVGRREAHGLPYGGAHSPTLQAHLVATARAYVEAVSGAPGTPPCTADEAIARLTERFSDGLGRTALRLLIGALGLFPTGTLVELSTGELAAVVATPDEPSLYSMPRVRVVLDMAGHPVDPPFEVDLAAPEPGMPPRVVRRVVTNAGPDAAPVAARAPVSSSRSIAPGSTRTPVPPSSARATVPSAPRSPAPPPSVRSAPRSPAPPSSGRTAPPPPSVRSATLPAPRPSASGRGQAPPTTPSPVRIAEPSGRDPRITPVPLTPSSPPTKPDRPQPAAGPEPDLAWDILGESPSVPAPPAAPMEETLESALDSDGVAPPSGRSAPAAEDRRAIAPPVDADVDALLAELDEIPSAPGIPIREPAARARGPAFAPVPLEVPLPDPPAPEPAAAIAIAPDGDADQEDGHTRQYSARERKLVAETAPPPPELAAAIVEAARPTPTAEGSFSKTPFVHLLVYLLDQGLTGTVTFFPPDGFSHDVYFEQGVAAKIRTGAMIWPLDRVLYHLRLAEEAKLAEALVEISRSKILLGRYLVMRGLVSRDDVLRALRIQLVQKLVSMSELPPETKYTFYADENLIKAYGGPELLRSEPLATVMAAVRASPESPAREATLGRIARVPLGFVPGADVSRFGLSREENAVCDLLRASRMRLGDLVSAGVAPEHVVKRTIYALAITRYLDLGAAQKPPVAASMAALPADGPLRAPDIRQAPPRDAGPSAPRDAGQPLPRERTPTPLLAAVTIPEDEPAPPAQAPAASAPAPSPRPATTAPIRPAAPSPAAAPAARPQAPASPAAPAARPPAAQPAATSPRPAAPDLAARRAEIQARASTVDAETHFEILGIARTATPEETRNAYFALAKRWHPDRTPPELADLKPLVASIFARIGEAYSTLGDAEKRKAYLQSLESPSTTARNAAEEEQVARAVNAALEFQKAEALLRKNDLAGAERHVRLAADADPGQPEYTTLLAWITALRRGEPKELPPGAISNHYDDIIQMLDEVLRGDPQYERALFYRGTLLKRSGRADKAIRDFRLVADLNPKNIDAVREVRLHEMRRRETKESEAQGGLFGKWFKR